MRIFHFILSHSIFIAVCAVALCLQTNILLQIPHDYNLYSLVFFSTICSYNFYWLLSKFYFSNNKQLLVFIKQNSSYFLLCILSGIALLYFLFQQPHLIKVVLVSVSLTLLYSLPILPFSIFKYFKKWGFFKTIVLSFSWAFVTTVLPYTTYQNITFAVELKQAVLLLLFVRFCFMLLLCILFDKRDTALDKMNGLHSMATDIKQQYLQYILLAFFWLYIIASLYFCYKYANSLQATAFISIGILFIILYLQSLKIKGYVFYYFGVDGLMLLSGIFTYLASIL